MALEDMFGISMRLGERLEKWLEEPSEWRARISFEVVMRESREEDAEIKALVEANTKEGCKRDPSTVWT
jgi:hypothetical protein